MSGGTAEARNGVHPLRPEIELLFTEPPAPAAPVPKITEKDLEDRAHQGFEAGQQKGIAEGQAQARLEFEKALAAERDKVAKSLEDFMNERDNYYQKVEPEVVRLALGIARKVLHRELQIDPLALTGIVRVTLEKLAAGGRIKIRVPAPQAAGWRNAIRPQDFPDIQFEIVPEDLLEGPQCAVGECCEIIDGSGKAFPGQVVGFRGSTVLSMPLDKMGGIRYGDRISAWGEYPQLRVGEGLMGRVLDATGQTVDSGPPCKGGDLWPIHSAAPLPLDRQLIDKPLGTGVRAIDGFITCGRGQRLGIFGGSGVGKSTLIGMMARESAADVTVLGLVGERGREVGEFLNTLGPEGLKRSVVVVSTSDQSPLLRIRAALSATAVAEYFVAYGKNVLLVVDSLTRVAMAQREIGLAAGEPPTSRGYTPSCFTLLAQLIERAGNFRRGSITAFYSVLMEGDDQQDTLVDVMRALLDGHIVLDRKLNMQGHFPPISILDSLSRFTSAVCSKEHLDKARRLRKLLASYASSEDLIRVGAYQKGLDAVLDQAVVALPAINAFLQQTADQAAAFDKHVNDLQALPG